MGVKNQMGSGDVGVEGLLWCQERGWFLQESLDSFQILFAF